MLGYSFLIGDPSIRGKIRAWYERAKTIVFYSTLALLTMGACWWTGYLLRLASGV